MKTFVAIMVAILIIVGGYLAYPHIKGIETKVSEVNETPNMAKNIVENAETQMSTKVGMRFSIERVEGVSENNMLKYILLEVKTGVGTHGINLHNARLTTSIGNSKEPAIYVPAMGKTTACDAEMYKLMKETGTDNIVEFVKRVAKNLDSTKFTVVWENCDNKDDIYTLSDGQTAYVIYPLPEPVPSSTYITIDLYVSDGWSNPMKIRVPAGLDKGYVLIYPTS